MAAPTIQTILKPTRARGLDTSGNNNHAQIYSGRGLEFDGVTDYLSVSSVTGVNSFSEGVAYSWATWINLNSIGSGVNWFLGKGSSHPNIFIRHTDGRVAFREAGTNAAYHYVSTTVLQINTWYRLVVTADTSNNMKCYINGVLDNTLSEGDSPYSGSGTFGVDGNNLGTEFTMTKIGGGYTSNSYPLDGMMSDFQIWNTTLTQDDVTYDYLNPEQLALNRGGTSLTNSNLKLWYPMNEGHRGNQSYVLDASNTGFNEAELLTNNSFDDGTTGWTLADPDDASVSASGGQLTLSIDAIDGSSGDRNAYIRQTALVIGKRYRVTIDIAQDNTGIGIRAEAMGGTGYGTAESVGVTTFDITAVASTDIVFRMLNISSPSETGSIVVNSVSIQGINNKNNATTVFYGDEQITEQVNRDFSGSGNWGNYGSSSTAPSISGGKLVCVTDGDGGNEGAQLALGMVDGTGSAYPIVAGRTYRMRAKLDNTAGKTTPDINFSLGGKHASVIRTSDNDTTGTIDTTEQEYYATIIAADNSTAVLIYQTSADNDATTTFTIDDVSIKEIGTAMGWTDADQQLDIPQTALQSYSQIPYNFTKGGSSSTSHFYTCDASVGTVVNNSFTLSMWLFSHDEDSGTQFLFSVNDRDAGYNTEEAFAVKWLTNGNIQFSYNINSGADTHSTTGQIFDSNDLGKWLHFAVSHNYSNDTTSVYKNGELITTKDHSTTMDLNIGGGTTQIDVHWGDASTFKGSNLKGAMNEMSVWNTNLSTSQIGEIYNNGSPLDCTTHSASSNLTNYWRNNGLAVWSDLAGSNNLTPTNFTETMLITAGADSSRDSQGFLMNRQRLTNSINGLYTGSSGGGTYNAGAVVQDSSTLDITGAFTIGCWVKLKDFNYSYNLIQKKTSWNGAGYGIYIHNSSKKPYLEWGGSGANQQASGGNNDIDTLDIWYFVYGVHDPDGLHNSGTGIDRLYSAKTTDTSLNSDGKTSMHAGNIDDAVATNDLPLTIGNHYGGGQASTASIHFTGEIDDVVVYNKALSPEQVLRNFKAGKRSHR